MAAKKPVPERIKLPKRIKSPKPKNNAEHAAFHYGFDLVDIKDSFHAGKTTDLTEEEKVKLMKFYTKENDVKKHIPKKMMFYSKPILKEKKARGKKNNFGLDIIGVESGLAEAFIIQTALAILKDEGYKDLSVKINAIGDKESVKRFEKEIAAFYKKNLTALKTADQKKVKDGKSLELFSANKESMEELHAEAPKPLFFLSEESSNHFKEVLEYMEEINMPYEIDDQLMGNKNYFSKTIFVITGSDEKGKPTKELARGGRYDELASEVTRKRKISAVGLSMDFKAKEKAPKNKKGTHDISIHLIKIGFNARLKSFEIMEAMRKLNIPLNHSMDETKISHQIEHAVDNDAKYALIIGHKEATENKVLIRDMETFSQNEVKLEDLPKYAKKLI